MAMVLKTIVAATSPWVRIPRPPLDLGKTGPDLVLHRPGSCPVFVTGRNQVQPAAAVCRWSRDIRVMDLEAFPSQRADGGTERVSFSLGAADQPGSPDTRAADARCRLPR